MITVETLLKKQNQKTLKKQKQHVFQRDFIDSQIIIMVLPCKR